MYQKILEAARKKPDVTYKVTTETKGWFHNSKEGPEIRM